MKNKTICEILVVSIALVIVVSGVALGANTRASDSNISLSSTTIHVPDDYSTIQEAVDKVSAGGTIIVREDTYTENVHVNKRLTIKSEKGPDKTIVLAFEVTADYVEIIGFTVKGSAGEGIYLMNADHCNISDNVVSGFYTGIKLNSSSKNNITNNIVSGHHGIYLSSSSNNNTLLNNIASNNDNQGITVEFSSENRIINNTVSNNWIGTVLEGSSNNRVVGNNVSGNKHHNIRVSNSNSNNVTNNSASNSGLGIYLRYSSSNNIAANTCLNNGWKGIRLLYSSNNQLISNNVSDGREEGIYLDSYSSNNWLIRNDALNNNNHGIFLDFSSSNNRIINNTVDTNHYQGIHLESSSNNITGNKVSNNPWGIVLYSSNSKKNRLSNNTVWNNTRGICIGYSSNNTLIKNNVSDNSDFGIYLESANNNTIYNNYFNNTNNSYDNSNNTWNITKTTGTNIVGGSYLGGNYWSDYDGTDLDGDKLGDTLLPYNCSFGIKNGGDWHPLIEKGVSGHKFNDINGDGVWDPTEPALANWTIKLKGTGSWFTSPVSFTTTTDGNGYYKFKDVPKGTYTMSEVLKDGWIQTLPHTPGTYSVTVTNGGMREKDFGNRRFWVSGHKFNDSNGNDVWDSIERPLANWTIKLVGTTQNGSKLSLTTTTDGNGSYKFVDVPKGNYTLSEVLMAGWNQTLPAPPGTYTITITNADERNKDFGNHRFIGTRDYVIVGAPGERVGDNETQGRAYVFYGSTDMLHHTLSTPNPIAEANFGWSVCTGDVGGDYLEEVIVGAPGEHVGENIAQGRAYVFYGSTDMLRHTLNTSNPIANASFGWSVCTGDVNCDGFDEIIVGAPGERVRDNEAQGRAYVFYGSTGTLRHTLDTPNPISDASFGWSICTGDVNCDGFEEVIVGAPGERVGDNEAQGRAYAFYGSTGTLRYTMDTPSSQPEASFGWSVCTGDVNCDGFEEVIVGAPGERVGDNMAQGRVYVFNGSTGTLRYTMDTPNPQPEASFGWSVCTGDVNCDGFEEIIVGAPGERVGDNKAQGRAYVFYGSTGTLHHTMDTPNPQPEASFGWSVCTGDVNCNGFEEVIVGAPGERVGDNKAQGRAYVFYGSTGTLHHTMDTPNPQPEASFGWSVCTGATSPP